MAAPDDHEPDPVLPAWAWPDPGRAGAADGAGRLSFPDVPRLELDQLLVQLVDHADDVLASQERLRGLLRANALVASELSLPVVLRQIVGAARDLLGARYAALGVLGRDGKFEEFVHIGMDDEAVGRIGALPRGEGILGLLISEPVPIRIADLAAHPASAGFPPGHPPMAGFVGVPIHIGQEVFGNLYLTERSGGGEFTAEDEELAIALATAAGAAIANARRFTESERRRRWLTASSELTPVLLSGGPGRAHTLIAEHAAAAAEADFAIVAVPHGLDQMIVAGASGALAMDLLDRTAPVLSSLAGRAILTGKGSLVTGERCQAAAAVLGADLGPLIVVPLTAGEQVRGALILGRRRTSPELTETHLLMAAAFAGHAAVAMELALVRADQLVMAQAADHDRIASDLHDHVIQELFALGMKLQSQASRSDRATAQRVNGYVDTLDRIIIKIRSSIFGLQQPPPSRGSLRARLRDLVEEHAPQLGFTAGLQFTGALEPAPDAVLANDILAVAREALSNCARHAHASKISISVGSGDDGLITLDITDNGRGLGTSTRSSGLANMRRRAERNGGTFQISTPAGGGTRLSWTACPHY